MDNILGDQVLNGRLIRPLTQELAVLILPPLIVALLQNKLQVSLANEVGTRESVRLAIPPIKKPPVVLLREDFDLFKKIAQRSSLRMFPSETIDDAIRRIRSYVAVEFYGR